MNIGIIQRSAQFKSENRQVFHIETGLVKIVLNSPTGAKRDLKYKSKKCQSTFFFFPYGI